MPSFYSKPKKRIIFQIKKLPDFHSKTLTKFNDIDWVKVDGRRLSKHKKSTT